VQSTALGSGNLAEILDTHPSGVAVRNNTCADYYLRLVVITPAGPPLPNEDAAAGMDDGGSAADADADAP
jgi:hypothetical protein